MKQIKDIETRWQNHLMVLCAFRYCLGKQAYIAAECVQWLCEWWDDLAELTRQRVIEETTHAIDTDAAGDICDQETWRHFIEYVTKEAASFDTASPAYLTNDEK